MTGTLYVSGPMSGRPGFNYPAFRDASAVLRAYGYAVLDPSEVRRPGPAPVWQDWMRSALSLMLQADAVALLPGWTESRGAELEVLMAKGLKMEVRTVEEWMRDAPETWSRAAGVLLTRAEKLEEKHEGMRA